MIAPIPVWCFGALGWFHRNICARARDVISELVSQLLQITVWQRFLRINVEGEWRNFLVVGWCVCLLVQSRRKQSAVGRFKTGRIPGIPTRSLESTNRPHPPQTRLTPWQLHSLRQEFGFSIRSIGVKLSRVDLRSDKRLVRTWSTQAGE